jgi:hypothetical protein
MSGSLHDMSIEIKHRNIVRAEKLWVANYNSLEVAASVGSAQHPRHDSVAPAACSVPTVRRPTL